MNPQFKPIIGAAIVLAAVLVAGWGLGELRQIAPQLFATIDVGQVVSVGAGFALYYVGAALQGLVWR